MTRETHGKLHHATPSWVTDGAIFHIRIRVHDANGISLVEEPLARRLLDSVRFYEMRARWYPHLFLLMPDHLHALLSFDLRHDSISHVVRDWKCFHKRRNGVQWQENFFDHRLRSREEFEEKAGYIRMNPVRKGLCATVAEWPFVLDGSAARGTEPAGHPG